ncbi:hypothetical protein H1R20_g9189, partial [Candolleomyces eurysporus]
MIAARLLPIAVAVVLSLHARLTLAFPVKNEDIQDLSLRSVSVANDDASTLTLREPSEEDELLDLVQRTPQAKGLLDLINRLPGINKPPPNPVRCPPRSIAVQLPNLFLLGLDLLSPDPPPAVPRPMRPTVKSRLLSQAIHHVADTSAYIRLRHPRKRSFDEIEELAIRTIEDKIMEDLLHRGYYDDMDLD